MKASRPIALENTDLARVDDVERQPGPCKSRCDSCFEAAGCLDDNEGDRKTAETVDKASSPFELRNTWNASLQGLR